MTKANESAYPTEQPLEFIEIAGQPGTRSVLKYGFTGGLTKRELFAAMAMQGLLSAIYSDIKMLSEFTRSQYTPEPSGFGYVNGCEAVSKNAVNYADALLKELKKETK